jgi:signal transduction histidine kinase
LTDRVQQLGGTFNIGEHEGRGVSLTADIPLGGRT